MTIDENMNAIILCCDSIRSLYAVIISAALQLENEREKSKDQQKNTGGN
jgi:hypothetical protein